MILAPDQHQRGIYADEHQGQPDRRARRSPSAHGFNIRFGYIEAPEGVDVILVAPKAPGHTVRREFEAGRGIPGHHRRRAGRHRAAPGTLAWSYAKAIGGTARRRHQDHLHRRDRDRPVRRAGRALRRHLAARPVRLRDPRSRPATSRRSPTSRCCTSSSSSSTSCGRAASPSSAGRSPTRPSTATTSPARASSTRGQGEHEGRARRHPVRCVRRSASSPTRMPAPPSSSRCARRAPRTRSRRPARSCARSSPGSSRTPTTPRAAPRASAPLDAVNAKGRGRSSRPFVMCQKLIHSLHQLG